MLVLLFLPIADSTWAVTLPALAFSIAWLLFDRVRSATQATLEYLLGTDCSLPLPDDNSESGTSQGLSILAFILTQSIALVASQVGKTAIREQPFSYKTTLTSAYAGITVIVLGSIIGLLRSTGIAECPAGSIAGKTQPKRSFDKGTLTFLRWVMGWGVLTSGLIYCAAWFGWLPAQVNQKRVKLDWTAVGTTVRAYEDPERREWQPEEYIGQPVIRLDAQLSPVDFPQEPGVPKSVTIAVSIDPEVVEKGWRIFSCNLFEGDPEKRVFHVPDADPTTNIGNLPAKRRFTIKLDELHANDTYTLCLWLYNDNKASEVKTYKDVVNSYARELNQNKERSKIIGIEALWSGH